LPRPLQEGLVASSTTKGRRGFEATSYERKQIKKEAMTEWSWLLQKLLPTQKDWLTTSLSAIKRR